MSQEVVHAGFRCNCSGRERIVSRDHHRANSHEPKLGQPLLHPAFHDIFQVDDAKQAIPVGHGERRATLPRNSITHVLNVAGNIAATLRDKRANCIGGSLPKLPSFEVDPAHARVGGEWNELGLALRNMAAPQSIPAFGQDYDGPALRCLVGQAGQLSCIGQFPHGDAIDRQEFHRLPITQRDGAGLVQQ